ncbi:stress-response A/B barrel domain-containing protein HS1-like isoform X2 [Vigna radiata var. radiata]|uniref:Stress-response A/B barrel domain-containing protein HS1-like isoform X2 n=1 Tax=Vigna radiata var. radiata TaxID=3916 RepID=A0A3Q0F247_VIGRR|nr:stress-response A/B barrel domain-containing protein HS1-like isoform X2 [Vigna radiata var. radiata]
MEEAKGVVKHLLLAKFKDDVTPEKIEELIKGYANLVNLIPPMKAFHWISEQDLCLFCTVGLMVLASMGEIAFFLYMLDGISFHDI